MTPDRINSRAGSPSSPGADPDRAVKWLLSVVGVGIASNLLSAAIHTQRWGLVAARVVHVGRRHGRSAYWALAARSARRNALDPWTGDRFAARRSRGCGLGSGDGLAAGRAGALNKRFLGRVRAGPLARTAW